MNHQRGLRQIAVGGKTLANDLVISDSGDEAGANTQTVTFPPAESDFQIVSPSEVVFVDVPGVVKSMALEPL